MNIIGLCVTVITVTGFVIEILTHPKQRDQLVIPRGDWLSVMLVLAPTSSIVLINAQCWIRPPVEPNAVLLVLGSALCAGCLAVRSWAKLTLGHYYTFSIDLRKGGHDLVDHGPYRWVRHPIYFGVALAIVGMPILAHSWWTVLIFSLPIGFVYGLRLVKEERFLMESLGAEYQEYARRTARLIPFVWQLLIFIGINGS